MQKEIQKARPRVLQMWFDELERSGRMVLRTSLIKTASFALIAWILVACLVVMFAVVPVSTWNPFGGSLGEDGGPLQFLMGLMFVAGFVLFGFGALLWTFVFPVVRPRLAISWWGVQSIGWKPGGTFTLFSAAWADIVAVGGIHTHTKWPFPPSLHVMLTARTNGVRRAPWIRVRSQDSTVVYNINTMLCGRRREVLAFLVDVHAAVRLPG